MTNFEKWNKEHQEAEQFVAGRSIILRCESCPAFKECGNHSDCAAGFVAWAKAEAEEEGK